MIAERVAARATPRLILALVLIAALGWRLNNIGFGLPSLYDPDEPIFMITALRMLAEGTFNPGWFGHPGSTTIYLIAAIDAAVASAGIISGHYAHVDAFAKAAYADPAMLFVPARVAMALIGTICVWLTYLLGSRLHGRATGLIAAALLAFNALHIAWSQVIRTDIHASVFMLASLLFAARIAEQGRLRDYLIAGAFAGLATATKWPAATVFVAIVGASIYAWRERGWVQRSALRVAAAAAAGLAAIFVASPYIFLDWQTVLANVSGEMSPSHLGHSGGDFFDNLAYYFSQPVMQSIGLPALLLLIAGGAICAVRSPAARWTMIPATLLFLALICSQNLIWSRWILPVMPMFCIFIAAALTTICQSLGGPRRWLAVGALAIMVAVPTLAAAIAQSTERANDTRAQAARWAVAHVPAGSRVLFEHLELSVRDQPWTILFPIGDAGCIDGVDALRNGVSFDRVQQMRRGSPIIDLGNVSPSRRESCRADFAILAYYDLYRLEAAHYPAELANYQALLGGGRTVALFRPVPGEAGGPVVRILALPKR